MGLMSKPNIVLVVADDLGPQVMAELMARGWMPNLKSAVADVGVTFVHAYAPNPWCGPGRASLLTGQDSHNNGVWMNEAPYGGPLTLADAQTLPVWLQAAGYRTGLVGKYLNGKNDWAHATTDLRDDPDYVPPGWSYWYEVNIPPTPLDGTGGAFNYYTSESVGRVPPTQVLHGTAPADYQTDVLSAKAVSFLAGTEPWFLMVTPHAPHADYPVACTTMNDGQPLTKTIPAPRHVGLASAVPLPQGAAFNEADVSDKPAAIRALSQYTSGQIACLQDCYRVQLESMMAVDDLIGAMVTTIGTQITNTAICFTSDNGYLFGQHRVHEKGRPYTESTRVPMYWRLPGVTTPTTTSRFGLLMDVPVTLCALAGATPGITVDGRDLMPVLGNPTYTPWRKRFLGTIRDGATTGASWVRTTPEATDAPNESYIKYTPDGSPNEQYDMANDAGQLANKFLSNVSPWPAHRTAMESKRAALATASGAAYRTLEDA